METLNQIILALASAPPEALMAIVVIGEMVFIYLIIKALISIIENRRS